MKGHNADKDGNFPDLDVNINSTDGTEYDLFVDPCEYELYRAYANEILDKVIRDIEVMKHNNGMIKAQVAQKICKRYKK